MFTYFHFSFYVLQSQMVYYLVSHTRVLTSVWFFSIFCPVHAAPAPCDPEKKWANKDTEQEGCHFPSSTHYNVPWTYLKLCQASLQASNGEKLWGEAYEEEEKPCCAHSETHPSKKKLPRDLYIFCNLTRLADDHKLALFSSCCLQMKVGCS